MVVVRPDQPPYRAFFEKVYAKNMSDKKIYTVSPASRGLIETLVETALNEILDDPVAELGDELVREWNLYEELAEDLGLDIWVIAARSSTPFEINRMTTLLGCR